MMSGKMLRLTPAQKSAVDSRGGAVLVSAAAGSGKTKVLVERLLGYVTDQNAPCDITEFLIITYTRAAANELRSKILDEISERLADEPDNRHLRRQAALCIDAHIGTIHSFCTDMLRENAHLVDMPPDFRVADENESGIIRLGVLEDLLEARYETMEQAPGFKLLVDAMSAGRDDKRLFDVILDAHTKLLSHPDPSKWAAEQLEMLENNVPCDASETIWGRYLMEDARRKSVYWRGVMEKLLSECSLYPEFEKAYGSSVAATAAGLDLFIQALGRSWDEARSCSTIDFQRPKNVKGCEELKEIRTKCREAMKKTAAVFECASTELLSDIEAVRPVVTELLRLVLDFNEIYGAAKRKRGIVDFSDLEHMTARLVTDRETGCPTPLAETISDRFTEIMIDEYQDCSGVQEVIFNAVSRDNRNIFMVGDVKQSIYRFRLADPSIFLAKYKSYKDETEAQDGDGRRILLSTNFRSGAGILSAVNFVFRNIMSEDFGEMAYTEREYLYPGRNDAVSSEPAVELDILDMSVLETEEDGETPEKAETEAAFVASRIEELIKSGLRIPDGQDGTRRISYGDFAILLRSVKDKAGVYSRMLEARNIPVATPDSGGYFDSQEIAVMISLLEIIDNPMQDVPLLAVLRSPVYGFTPDELACIRLADKKADFYTALTKAAETDDKSRAFLNELKAFRETAPDMTADRLIWHVFNKTSFLGVIGALRGGEARRENLMRLLELAVRYEANGYKGLFGFLSFIRKLIENGAEPGEKTETLSGDAVKIMSIHKSKGLEFPIVILADTTKRFNNKDASKPLLIHAQLGVGAKVTDLTRRIEYPTIARLAVARKLTREMTAEELRILYVAMTRAREKLIIVAAFADADRELAKLSKDAAAPMPPQVLEAAGSMAEFILLPALTRPEAGCLRGEGEPVTCDDAWDIRKVNADSIQGAAERRNQPEQARVKAGREAVEALRQKLGYTYPYQKAALIPSKLTATELKGRYTDYEAADEADTPDYAKKRRPPALRPDFITQRTELTPAEKGTALHLAMQFIDFSKCGSMDGIREELRRLREKSFLNAQQADGLEPGKILSFFASTLGKRVMQADKLYREFKFSLLVRAGDYFNGKAEDEDADNDEILFQGVVDCCFEENGALHVIDFKSDYVTGETLDEKTRLYAPQLNAYGRAMERIIGLPVKSKLIYFFAIDKVSEVG